MQALVNTKLLTEVGDTLFLECLWPAGTLALDSLWPLNTFLAGQPEPVELSLHFACSQDDYFTVYSDLETGVLYILAYENGDRVILEQGGYIFI